MSKQTAQILEAFEALPEEEKRIFTEFLRRTTPFDSGPLDDGETALAADQLLGELQTEENYADLR